jgi:hypothetical protein
MALCGRWRTHHERMRKIVVGVVPKNALNSCQCTAWPNLETPPPKLHLLENMKNVWVRVFPNQNVYISLKAAYDHSSFNFTTYSAKLEITDFHHCFVQIRILIRHSFATHSLITSHAISVGMAVKDYVRSRRRSTTIKHETAKSFDSPTIIGVFSSILFDMDGTLIDSTDAIVQHWERYITPIYNFVVNGSHKVNRVGKMYGLDPKIILATSHGRRSIDIFKEIDPANANWERK